jgi:hypothetical protein
MPHRVTQVEKRSVDPVSFSSGRPPGAGRALDAYEQRNSEDAHRLSDAWKLSGRRAQALPFRTSSMTFVAATRTGRGALSRVGRRA